MSLPENKYNTYKIKKYADGQFNTVSDAIAEEVLVRIFLNRSLYASLSASPWELDELAAGYLYGDGAVVCREDIIDISVDGYDVYVTTKAVPDTIPDEPESVNIADLMGSYTLSPSKILELSDSLESSSGTFHHTGGVHNAALSDGRTLLVIKEDVSRHNSLDRVVGYCLLNGIDTTDKVIVFSGRVPEEIISKIIAIGCSTIISVSAPTSMSIASAEAAGVTLICFARRSRFNVYTHPCRVTEE